MQLFNPRLNYGSGPGPENRRRSARQLEDLSLHQVVQLIALPLTPTHLGGRAAGLEFTLTGFGQGLAQGPPAQLGGPAMEAMEGSRTRHDDLLVETPSVYRSCQCCAAVAITASQSALS